MIVVYREPNAGRFRYADVANLEVARQYEPYFPMPDEAGARTLVNHLGGHEGYPKSDCRVCNPTPDAPAPEVVLSNGEKMSQAINAAEERLKARGR